jgi:hypothetical protein
MHTKFIIPRTNIKRNAIILIDHLNLGIDSAKTDRQMIARAYPMVTFKLRNTTGNTVPPIDEANEIIPKAVDNLLLNQWAIILITGPNTTPDETYK